MYRKEFGKLVAALRQDLEWTQLQLAEYGGLDPATISQIERGVKRHLEPERLVKLANALQLTTLERREFLFASTGNGNQQVVREPSSRTIPDRATSAMVLDRMVRIVENLRLPAFLVDVYWDVLAVNLIALAFFDVPAQMMANGGNLPGGFNAIRLVFGKDLAVRSHFTADWDAYARNSMAAFRQQTLRYRAQPYFKDLIKVFRNPSEYPLFNRFWRMVSSVELDQESDFQIFSYSHDTFGHLEYMSASFSALTRDGDLVLVYYQPMDENTAALFHELAVKNGREALRLAPWPDKKEP